MGLFKKAYVNVSASTDAIVITPDVKRTLQEANLNIGIIEVFSPNTTSAIAILENDPKVFEDYKKWIESQVPASNEKRPERRSGTGRNFAHLRAQCLNTSITIPVADSKLQLGSWQEIVFFDFDDKIARREYFILATGESAAAER